jgi:ubiquinone/menaquinone biosynthesis C-methylase UbiE
VLQFERRDGSQKQKDSAMDLKTLHATAAAMTPAQWSDLWLRAASGEHVAVDLPAFPPEKVQKITNNLSGVETMRGAAEFYRIADQEMAKHLPRDVADLKLLDFGAGWGRITRLFLRSMAPENLYGIDVDERLVAAGRELLPSLNFEQLASGGSLPYDDAQFDVVVANSVFSHLSLDFHLFYINELARVMRAGGLLLATTLSQRHFETAIGAEKTKVWLSAIFPDIGATQKSLLNGNFVHGDTQRWTGYGMTYIPDGWAAAHWAPCFEVLGIRPDYSQDIQIAIRNPR